MNADGKTRRGTLICANKRRLVPSNNSLPRFHPKGAKSAKLNFTAVFLRALRALCAFAVNRFFQGLFEGLDPGPNSI